MNPLCATDGHHNSCRKGFFWPIATFCAAAQLRAAIAAKRTQSSPHQDPLWVHGLVQLR